MSDAANAIVALAAMVGLLCLFYGPWQALCVDVARHLIFERRDRLFDMALAGRIDFNSEAYQRARRLLNSMLRFAHVLTWPDMIVAVYFCRPTKSTRLLQLDDALATVDPGVRKEIKQLISECSTMMAAMMLMKSIFIGPIVVVIGFALACTAGINKALLVTGAQERLEPLNTKIQETSAEYGDRALAVAA